MVTTALLTILLAQSAPVGLPEPYSKESKQLRTTVQAPVHNYSVTANTFVDALIEVAGQFKFPIGIAWVRKASELKPIHLSWSDATVEQVVRDIVKAHPGYEIEVRNAVVHVRPHDMVSSKESFLRLRIPRFDAQNEVAEIASKRLAALANMKVTPPKPLAPGQAKGGIAGSQLVEVGDPEISISLADVTVEDALDAISLASPFKVWLVTFDADASLTPGGFRRTVLASGKAVPDQYQPVWELLKWGRTPY
jgi:hypothetical protein